MVILYNRQKNGNIELVHDEWIRYNMVATESLQKVYFILLTGGIL